MTTNLISPHQKTKKSTSFDQNKIKIICDKLCDNIEDLLDHFNIEYKINNRFITMSCPIHGGDNLSALNLYHTGDYYRGNWKCRTHQCEDTFKGSIIGFVRGILSNKHHNWSKNGDSVCSFNEALEYCSNFIELSYDDIKIAKDSKDKTSFINQTRILNICPSQNIKGINRSTVQNSLSIPSNYFISRGFSAAILEKYDIGECHNNTKEMYNRAVVPIYDVNHSKMIGCSGRSIFEKCTLCNCYHKHNDKCPKDHDMWKYSKWRHSHGLKTQEHLYNYWYAKEYIAECHTVVLVESPGNVWKLEEHGIKYSVALFGTNLTDLQKTLLDSSGAMNIITIMDNDEAGHKATENIYNKCNRIYNIKNLSLPDHVNDIAECSNEELNSITQNLEKFTL